MIIEKQNEMAKQEIIKSHLFMKISKYIEVLRNTYDVIDLNYILLHRLKVRKYMFVTANVHFLFRSDEKLTVNENNVIFFIKFHKSTLSIMRSHGNETHHTPQILIKMQYAINFRKSHQT